MTREDIIHELTKVIEIADKQKPISNHIYHELIAYVSWERIVHLSQLLNENNFCPNCMYAGKCIVDRLCETQAKGG